MNLIGPVFAETARRLTDLGVRRGRGRTLTVPGHRGDAIVVGPQAFPSGVPDKAEFVVKIWNHLVPWTAWTRDDSLEEARTRKADYDEGVYCARLMSPSASYLSELWEVTPESRAAVADELTSGLREALTKTWLPILPRAELRALVRDRQRRGPSHLPNSKALEVDLMCRVEDLDGDDLHRLVSYFHTRAADNPDLGRLARWIERNILMRRSS